VNSVSSDSSERLLHLARSDLLERAQLDHVLNVKSHSHCTAPTSYSLAAPILVAAQPQMSLNPPFVEPAPAPAPPAPPPLDDPQMSAPYPPMPPAVPALLFDAEVGDVKAPNSANGSAAPPPPAPPAPPAAAPQIPPPAPPPLAAAAEGAAAAAAAAGAPHRSVCPPAAAPPEGADEKSPNPPDAEAEGVRPRCAAGAPQPASNPALGMGGAGADGADEPNDRPARPPLRPPSEPCWACCCCCCGGGAARTGAALKSERMSALGSRLGCC